MEFDWRIIVGTVIGFLGAALGNVGGVGEGGIFVPMVTLIIGFDPKTSTAISKFIITGAAIGSVHYNLKYCLSYTKLLAVLQVQRKGFGIQKKVLKNRMNGNRSLEMETWHDLANVYTSLCQWRDAETCLSKSEAISSHSASRWHYTGLLYEAKGFHTEALMSFGKALDIETNHVPSLISTAVVLRQLSDRSLAVAKSFLTYALRLEITNPSAWYNLGLLYKSECSSVTEAAECFEAAALLQESAPVEPFNNTIQSLSFLYLHSRKSRVIRCVFVDGNP